MKVVRMQAHNVRRVAVEAQCDPRTVTKYLGGGEIRGFVGERIKQALEKFGLSIDPQANAPANERSSPPEPAPTPEPAPAPGSTS